MTRIIQFFSSCFQKVGDTSSHACEKFAKWEVTNAGNRLSFVANVAQAIAGIVALLYFAGIVPQQIELGWFRFPVTIVVLCALLWIVACRWSRRPIQQPISHSPPPTGHVSNVSLQKLGAILVRTVPIIASLLVVCSLSFAAYTQYISPLGQTRLPTASDAGQLDETNTITPLPENNLILTLIHGGDTIAICANDDYSVSLERLSILVKDTYESYNLRDVSQKNVLKGCLCLQKPNPRYRVPASCEPENTYSVPTGKEDNWSSSDVNLYLDGTLIKTCSLNIDHCAYRIQH